MQPPPMNTRLIEVGTLRVFYDQLKQARAQAAMTYDDLVALRAHPAHLNPPSAATIQNAWEAYLEANARLQAMQEFLRITNLEVDVR